MTIRKHQIKEQDQTRLATSGALGSYREQLPWTGNSKTSFKREVNEFSNRALGWPLRRAEVEGVCRSRLGYWTKAIAIGTSRLSFRNGKRVD